MPSLDDIPVRLEAGATGPQDSRSFGHVLPILSEVRAALARLADTGEPGRIDLAGMPFGPGDEERLMALLGEGEVTATVEAMGPTHIRETRFPGVWVVDYANAEGQRVALHIEIAAAPQILCAQPADLPDALAELDAQIGDLVEENAPACASAEPGGGASPS